MSDGCSACGDQFAFQQRLNCTHISTLHIVIVIVIQLRKVDEVAYFGGQNTSTNFVAQRQTQSNDTNRSIFTSRRLDNLLFLCFRIILRKQKAKQSYIFAIDHNVVIENAFCCALCSPCHILLNQRVQSAFSTTYSE